MTKKTVAIIGAGRVGGSIGRLLARAGYPIAAVTARTTAAAEKARVFVGCGEAGTDAAAAASRAGVVIITTPDRAIKETCSAIASGGGFKAGAVVVHVSGAHSLDLLNDARAAGAFRAVIHPLQSVPSMELGVKNLPGSSFRVEADPEALTTARELVKAMGGIELAMPKWRPDRHSAALYHAGAVAVSNFFVALVDYGLRFYEALGADKREALKAVLPLIRGTLANIETAGIPDALTGPVMRGDVETIRSHLEAMRERAPELVALYQELTRHTVSVARDKGSITPGVAAELLALLK